MARAVEEKRGRGRLGPLATWAGSGQEKRKGRERKSSWAEAAVGPPTWLDRGERESKGDLLLFYFLKGN
jgi:hypothetical protein